MLFKRQSVKTKLISFLSKAQAWFTLRTQIQSQILPTFFAFEFDSAVALQV